MFLQGQATSIYNRCSDPEQCFGYPKRCEDKKDCEMITSLKHVKGEVHVELMKTNLEESNYVAMAFSEDEYMGKDVAFVCSPSWESEPKVNVFWNEPNKKNSVPTENFTEIAVPKNVSVSFQDSKFTCSFTVDKLFSIAPSSSKYKFDLEKGYYVLLATGPTEQSRIKKHTGGKISSNSKFGIKGKIVGKKHMK